MEARRRLAVISSHICQPGSGCNQTRLEPVSASGSSSGSDGDQGKSTNGACVFCRIIRGESPAFKIYEDDACLCILDSNPLSRGHSLIIPKFHFSSLDTTPPSVIAAMCSKVPLISSAIVKATGSDSFNLLVNNGAAAGQVIFHSLRRQSLKLDQEASRLADLVREQLSSSSSSLSGNCEVSEGEGSNLSRN
ncbi:adenylylsulfatase HINT3 isoform X2 [Humulus lupulus]|uniref:adenylylsulfatase HINT3 isoform X2 n=1 Tax=Humulus lupulus TaxID=3486 RepID=UPI002B410584|nr:adenylylsulfatase HINT3 isoform X2 [Humulus lupulus]